jgi:hypothetical protein
LEWLETEPQIGDRDFFERVYIPRVSTFLIDSALKNRNAEYRKDEEQWKAIQSNYDGSPLTMVAVLLGFTGGMDPPIPSGCIKSARGNGRYTRGIEVRGISSPSKRFERSGAISLKKGTSSKIID